MGTAMAGVLRVWLGWARADEEKVAVGKVVNEEKKTLGKADD